MSRARSAGVTEICNSAADVRIQTAMSNSFFAASGVAPNGDFSFTADFPDGWQQGRGAFGGLVLATLLRAMESCEPDRARRVRVLTGDLCGPVPPGASTIAVRVLRRGHHQSNLHAELSRDGDVLALASAIFGSARVPDLRVDVAGAAPAAPDWQSVPPIDLGSFGPRFAQHYEHRNLGPLPGSLGQSAETLGFIREREPLARFDAPALIGRLDAWWPALFSVGTMRPMATVSFTAELFCDAERLAPEQPLLHRARVVALREGYFLEERELWSGGQVVALNQQTFSVIK